MTNIFKFNDQPLRHIELDGEPWFVAADVCRILGLAMWRGKAKTANACRKLDDSEKGAHLVDTPGGPQRLTVVSESGLYKLIMRSDKDTARPFQDWVTKEVLPSIRRTGGYLLNEAARETAHADTRSAMPLPEEFQRVFAALMQPVIEPLRAEVVSLREQIAKLTQGEAPQDYWWTGQPMSSLTDRHLQNARRKAEREGDAASAALCVREMTRRRGLKRAA